MTHKASEIKKQFPILDQQIHGHPLVYLDNAATSQKPQSMIDDMSNYYKNDNANIHRGMHELSERATKAYEETRQKTARFINAPEDHEIIYTKGATESINMVAKSYIEKICEPGDAIVISELEHHANIVPWQILKQRLGLEIRWLPVNDRGEIELEHLPPLLADGKVKLVACNWISNSLGTINPVQEITKISHQYQALVLLDACQVPAHQAIDLSAIGCDFLALSAHKMFGPTGIGVLSGKKDLLENFDYWHGGGDMIVEVSFDDFIPHKLPNRLEAGTPAIAEVVGLGSAIDWISNIDLKSAEQHELQLLDYTTEELKKTPNIRLVGEAKEKSAVVSFTLSDGSLHPSDIATLLNLEGIAVRSGHHCTMPILKKLKADATVRASFALYNTMEDAERLIAAVHKIIKKYT